MATRRPLVVVSGRIKYLPAADSLDFDWLSNLPSTLAGHGITLTSGDVTTALGYTPVNKAGDTMSGDLSVLKSSAAINVGISATVNGGLINLGAAGVGSIAIYSAHAAGAIRLRPNGGGSTVGQVLVDVDGLTVSHASLTTASIAGGPIFAWNAANTDIDGLLPGTAGGIITEGSNAGHYVIGLRSNDINDGLYLIDKGNAATPATDPYVNLVFAVSRAQLRYQGNDIYHAGNLTISDYLTTASAAATYVPLTRTVTAGNGMTGGGALSGNITLTMGAPSSLSPTSTNSLTSGSHTHAVSFDIGAIALADPLGSYPTTVPVIGTTTGTIYTTLTANVSANRAFQFLALPNGGTTPPDLYVRSSHTSVGGGGWTSQARVWHDLNQLALGTTAGTARTALALGTAATQNTGTSGANVPLLNGANIWSASQTVNVASSLGDWIITVAGATAGGIAADTSTPRVILYGTTGSTINFRPDGRGSTTGAATLTSAGVFTATSFVGSGTSLTGLTAANITASTTVGRNILNLTNPSVLSFLRINADNTVTARSQANFQSDLGLGTSATVNTGTSGATIPLLNTAVTWTGNQTINGDLVLNTAGNGLKVKEGTNARMGTVTLVAGEATVNTTAVTANSRIFLTIHAIAGGQVTSSMLYTKSRVAGTSFVIADGSGNALNTSTVAWMIVEPA